ncbi:MAG: NADH dehydrogenase [Spirochaetes bacterium GWB1_48_6]|nr:MAG: NADH dehydrogenase [Spirochaetes bacterium GWB1_48_6]
MAVITEEDVALTPELLKFIDEWKGKAGNLIMILHKTQEQYGFIPRNVAIKLSQKMDVPLAKIYGVITFYHYFKLTKPGKFNIQICMGTACYLKGAGDLILELENLLGIGVNQVTDDGHFSMESVRCIGCCGLAPVMTVGGEVFGKVNPDMLPEILAKFQRK